MKLNDISLIISLVALGALTSPCNFTDQLMPKMEAFIVKYADKFFVHYYLATGGQYKCKVNVGICNTTYY